MKQEVIMRALGKMRARLAQWERNRNALTRQITAAQEEERLLLRLLALSRGERGTTGSSSEARSQSQSVVGKRSVGREAVQAAVQAMSVVGHPLSIAAITKLLHEQKVEIPGAGQSRNLGRHLRDDPRFVRLQRGTYALVEWIRDGGSVRLQGRIETEPKDAA
jgi:hypothetical protein